MTLALSSCKAYQGYTRYPCQEYKNWNKPECQKPQCIPTGTCTDDLLGNVRKGHK